jgi:hypothetical protein
MSIISCRLILLRVRGGGGGLSAARQVNLNNRTPGRNPIRVTARMQLMRLIYRTRIAANSASASFVSESALQPVSPPALYATPQSSAGRT